MSNLIARLDYKKVLKGEKGDRGERGLRGEKGDKGDTGPVGPQGPAGKDGTITNVKFTINEQGHLIAEV